MMAGAASELLTSGLTVDHVPDEPADVEAATAAEAGEDQEDGEFVDLDEIEIDAPTLLDVNDPSAPAYELSITVAQEPGMDADVMRPDAEAIVESAPASEPSVPVETGAGEVDAIRVAEPEADRAESLEAVVYDLPIGQDDSQIETQAVILPFTPPTTTEFSAVAMDQSTRDEFTAQTDDASPEFSTGQVVSFESYTAAPIVTPIDEAPPAAIEPEVAPGFGAETCRGRTAARRGRCRRARACRDRFPAVDRAVGRERAAGRVRVSDEPASRPKPAPSPSSLP